MSLASAPLPTDPDALRMFAAGLQAELARKEIEIAANAAEIYAKTLHIEKLKMQLAVLRRARFGRSSEKLDRDIEQLELLIGELEEEQAEGDARVSAADPAQPHPAQTRERKQPVRKPLPAHLPRQGSVKNLGQAACPSRADRPGWALRPPSTPTRGVVPQVFDTPVADLPLAARLHAATARAVAAGQESEAGAASDALVEYIETFARKTIE